MLFDVYFMIILQTIKYDHRQTKHHYHSFHSLSSPSTTTPHPTLWSSPCHLRNHHHCFLSLPLLVFFFSTPLMIQSAIRQLLDVLRKHFQCKTSQRNHGSSSARDRLNKVLVPRWWARCSCQPTLVFWTYQSICPSLLSLDHSLSFRRRSTVH